MDLPGHGKSEGVGRQVIAEYAADIIAFMDALKLRAAVIVGHSMGSAIALTLAIQHPRRVLGLGLIGSGARLRVAPALLESAANPATFASAVQMVTDFSYGPQADPRLKELGNQQMAETRPPVLYGDFLACDEFNVSDELPRLKIPTLVLVGKEDRMTPLKYSQALADGIPNARLQVIPDAGHMLMLEQPAEVASALAGFLSAIPYQRGQ